jgi:putative addiction module component (TIGR02574 family)
MTQIAEQLKVQLSRLPADDRAELAHFLIDTLDETTDADAEAAWDIELARREAEIRSGTAVGEPAASVFARIRDRLA